METQPTPYPLVPILRYPPGLLPAGHAWLLFLYVSTPCSNLKPFTSHKIHTNSPPSRRPRLNVQRPQIHGSRPLRSGLLHRGISPPLFTPAPFPPTSTPAEKKLTPAPIPPASRPLRLLLRRRRRRRHSRRHGSNKALRLPLRPRNNSHSRLRPLAPKHLYRRHVSHLSQRDMQRLRLSDGARRRERHAGHGRGE